MVSFYHRITLWQQWINVLIYNYNDWFITINMCSSIYLQRFQIFVTVVSKPLLKLSILSIFIQKSISCMHVQMDFCPALKNSISLFSKVLECILIHPCVRNDITVYCIYSIVHIHVGNTFLTWTTLSLDMNSRLIHNCYVYILYITNDRKNCCHVVRPPLYYRSE